MRNKQDIVVGSKGGLKTKYHYYSSCVFSFVLCFWSSKNICSFLFCISNDIKNVQFGVEMRENLKVFGDRVPFVVYPSCNLVVT